MAISIIDVGVGDHNGTDTFTLEAVSVQAGDTLIVTVGTYQVGSTATLSVSDNVNGAWDAALATFDTGQEEPGDAWRHHVFVYLASAAGTVTVTVDPGGAAAESLGAVVVARGSTALEVLGANDAVDTSSPVTAQFTLPSREYLMVGSVAVIGSTVSSVTLSAGTELWRLTGGGYGETGAYRIVTSTNPSLSWTFSASGLETAGWAAVVLAESSVPTIPRIMHHYRQMRTR